MACLRFGEAVRLLRERQGLTQAELAKRAKLARQSLIRIEQSPSTPPSGTYSRLVGALGFSLGRDLFAATGDTREPLAVSGFARTVAPKRAELAPAVTVSPRPAAVARPLVFRSQKPRRRLASSTARGYGQAHRRLRKFILLRDPWCRGFPLGIHGLERVPSTVMDHNLSLRRGGTTSPENCFGSCRACNARKAVLVEGAGYQRRRSAQRVQTMQSPTWRLLA